ncbi:ATP phosphoribosyltransferase regulatory subunit [Andreesenia angusta]|uniref:ATP phosphoribosyltransferase regulatory subunit n=1 Tax=Andreesenia angusta TaxID=39480 RepID=A0A1S1V757_9FIRM|nr:ATP phosphoribosyltransferase regulatory subunit [Andreesenia angusta]OHW62255.1 ATP phosphoribosyltransferase regulatory subunit [Andreesenia angusta]
MIGFQTPQGVRDELFREYEEKQNMLKGISGIFKSFGYREVATPTIEYYEVFSSIKSSIIKNEIFKLIDKSGELLALRPDATIPIARIVANNYKSSKKNYKLFYNTQVFKMSNEKKREVTQTGVEYFGNINPEADAEVISIAIKTLIENGAEFHIEIGNAGYYKGLLEEVQLSDVLESKLKELVESKNFAEIKKFVESLDISEEHREILAKIPDLYGDFTQTLEEAEEYCLNDNMRNAVEDLKEIYDVLSDYGYEDHISLDLGLINDLDYYTGMVFKGYVKGYGETVLSGGRYDTLTKYYGQYIPATGFGLNVDDLINAITVQEAGCDASDKYIDYKINYKKDVRKSAIELAESLRSSGYVVELERKDSFEKLGEELGVSKLISLGESESIELEDMETGKAERLSVSEFKEKI